MINDEKIMENYNQIFAKRTKKLALDIIVELCELKYSDKISNIRKQVIRSSSSSACNYRAMCRARSLKEKYSKICIVVEEADETLFWLEMIEELSVIEKGEIKILMQEADEILKTTASYKKKLKEDLDKNQG